MIKAIKLWHVGVAHLFFLSLAALGADIYDVPKVGVLENKLYSLHDEGAFRLSYLALDPYIKYVSVGGSYTHFFSEFTGWEVIDAQYAFGFDSGLKKDLQANFATNCPTPSQCATADKFRTLQALATTNLVFTPLYTKNLLFNSKLVYSQASFVGGGGAGIFTTPITNVTTYQPCVDIGVVLRYFLTRSSSLMFNFRDYVFLNNNTKNQLGITVAYTFNLGSTDKK